MREMPPVEDLGNGMWSVPVPIPGNPLGYTLVYVLESAQGPVLVDAGWEHEDSLRALTDGLAAAGTGIAEVRGVVVTHFHPDHSGLAGRVRDASGAWIAMHHADVDMVRHIRSLDPAAQSRLETGQLRAAGASAEEIAAYTELGPRLDPPALPDRPLSHGDLVDLPDRKLRVVWTPGHSPGHICLHLEDGDHLFTGDHVLPRITPHIGLYPFDDASGDPLGAFLDSLAQIHDDVGSAEALPAHEHRFTGIAARTAEIMDHHERKLDLLAALLGRNPATLWELAAALPWQRGWAHLPVHARRMAASETAAHLRTLERRGRALRRTAPGGVLEWTAPTARN
ncbi:MBL fold metallo-hydrolase [Nocardiopsis sediminis]|uniref:MBL fold metallo-hydrolase n=1 Tax=Nocardiopsis sediminis TaxID=1778267 RepID=A0ABV8FKC0_9ACTN